MSETFTITTQLLVNHLPCNCVEEMVRLVFCCLKEADKVVKCPRETLWIWLVLQEGHICFRAETREKRS